MPKLATADFFRNRPLQIGEILEPPEKNGLKGMVPVAGIMCALVPGMPDAALVALRDYGTKSFNEVVAPALEFADGSAIDEMRSRLDRRQPRVLHAVADFDGALHARMATWPLPGEIFRQPDLARTLRAMVEAEKKALARAQPRGRHRRGARLFLSRRDREEDRRVQQGESTACCATKIWPRFI